MRGSGCRTLTGLRFAERTSGGELSVCRWSSGVLGVVVSSRRSQTTLRAESIGGCSSGLRRGATGSLID